VLQITQTVVVSVVPLLTESAPCQPVAGLEVEPPTGWSVSRKPGTVPETPPAIAFGNPAGQVAVAVDTPDVPMMGLTVFPVAVTTTVSAVADPCGP
jgi:hypothetical protein